MKRFNVSSSAAFSTGFERYPSNPALRARSSSPRIASAVKATSGIEAVAGSDFSLRAVWG